MDTWIITNQTRLKPTHGGREYHNPQHIHAITGPWLWFVDHFRRGGDVQGEVLHVGAVLVLHSVDDDAASAALGRRLVGFNDGNAPGAVLKGNKEVLLQYPNRN